jgi:hypothetical protein
VHSFHLPSGDGSSIRRARVSGMRCRELQHIILEVGARFALREVFVIGSSAILAVMPDPPEGALTATRDVDIIPPNDEDERIADRRSESLRRRIWLSRARRLPKNALLCTAGLASAHD